MQYMVYLRFVLGAYYITKNSFSGRRPLAPFHLTEITMPNGTLVTVAASVGSLSRLTP